uniref:Sushi domain-containing protein n=1 Tax=Acrobeloides nanus TaxID=290746 RepID=A0A914E927_9BILA
MYHSDLPPGVEKVAGPGDGDLIKDGSETKVYFNTIYKFKCKDGQPNVDGRTEQMLICRGGADGYYDSSTTQIRAQVMSCSKKSCERIRDLKISAQLVTQKYQCAINSDGKYTDGCKLAIRCKEGYYMAKAKYVNGQKIVCSGGTWVEEEKVKAAVSFKMAACQPGCKALREDNPFEMRNATFIGVGKPTKIYKHEEFDYWASGTVVETKCKDGFAFDDEDNRKRGQDKHICINGEWYDFAQNKSLGTRPGLCPPLCNAIDDRDLPTGVTITVNPANYDGVMKVGEKGYVYSGIQYKFNCIKGYQYASGKTEQTLICKGGDLKYYDAATGKNQATIDEATNIDINATIVSSNRVCANPISSSTVPEGCELHTKCHEETHYYENIDYSFGQKLICKGNVWVDQTGKVVVRSAIGKYTDDCKPGCKALTDSDMLNATYVQGPPVGSTLVHKNGETVIWSQGVVIVTQCKKFYARTEDDDRHNEPNSYICSAGNGWVNLRTNEAHQQPGQCEPMCVMPSLTTGTSFAQQLDDSLTLIVDHVRYVYSSIILRVKCDHGYELPKGGTYPNGEQQLLCKGGNLGYYDIALGKSNVVPVACVKSGAPGCGLIKVSETNSEIVENGCELKDGLQNPGCKVVIKCKRGYYPDVTTVLEKSQQTLECKAGNDGWMDVKTQVKNTIAATCQPVCPELKNMDRIDVVQGPDEKDIVCLMFSC